MLAVTLDITPLPQWSALVIAYRHEAATSHWESAPHSFLVIRYEPGNALTTAQQNVERRKDSQPDYQPRTELGKRLLALRQAFIESGGQLLSAEALDQELRIRRGGVGDA
jgi:hypothetical protein